ncbi:MAG TPA: ferredoxin reductase [Candidatus Angelobacter sp.]|jgi:ferredoxin-NADP reductase|nr:ferredoxin reductase [Candidatus Angelobacter sp.]
MARAALHGRLSWQPGTVVERIEETPRVRSLVLALPEWPGHLAGQHVDVRLTADDGYQTERSYSISSAPSDDDRVELTVERLDDGEVSPYLADELRAGDEIELRGPVGGYFVWDVPLGGPLLLVAGGSGICPLMAMVRHRARAESTVPARLIYSSRSLDDVIYRAELDRLAEMRDGLEVVHTLTRARPAGWSGYGRRIDGAMLAEVAWPPDDAPLVYVCGPTPLVESVAEALVGLGHDAARIRTERFGPTGG